MYSVFPLYTRPSLLDFMPNGAAENPSWSADWSVSMPRLHWLAAQVCDILEYLFILRGDEDFHQTQYWHQLPLLPGSRCSQPPPGCHSWISSWLHHQVVCWSRCRGRTLSAPVYPAWWALMTFSCQVTDTADTHACHVEDIHLSHHFHFSIAEICCSEEESALGEVHQPLPIKEAPSLWIVP